MKKVSGSRFRRLTKVGWLSRKALPIAWKRLREASATKTHEERAALAKKVLDKHADLAEEAFRTLGELKGIALKVGQMAAYVDGAIPEAYREVYQEVLQRLLQNAPALPWSSVEPVLVSELGGPVTNFFTEFEQTPFAAASIGQVHRARLKGGTMVAVKVQYPGVDRAMASDLKNVSMFKSLAAPLLGLVGRGEMYTNMGEILTEIRERMLEELDYVHEARMQERFRDLCADDPAVRIPRVYRECSSRRVLTTELMRGRTLQEVCQAASQEQRNRYGQVLNRSMLRSVYEFQLFNADPHPGNYLFPDDGSVVLLDFGCVKKIPNWMRACMEGYFGAAVVATRTGSPRDWERFDAQLQETFKLDRADPDLYVPMREFILYTLRPYLRDQDFDFTPEYTGESIDRVLSTTKEAVFGKGKLPRIPKMPPFPADFTFLSRLQWGFYSVLTMLRARGNWHRDLPERIRIP